MGLPNALMGLEEQADKLHRDAYPEQYAPPAGTPPPAAPSAETPDGEQPPTPAQTPPDTTPASDQPPAETPAETPPAPAAAQPDGLISKADYDALQHKFSVLQGKYNAEIPRLSDELNALKNRTVTPPSETPPGTPPPDGGATMEERIERLKQEYGPEFLEDIEYFLRPKIMKELEGVKQTVENVAAVTSQAQDTQFLTRLSTIVPEWPVLVKDPAFVEFMNAEEGNSGVPRLENARKFQGQRNAEKLAKYYVDFKSTRKPSVTPAPGTPTPGKPTKEALVAPATTPTGQVPTGREEIPIMRASELDKFARDVNAGLYRGRDKEYAAMDAKITAAQAAGRIIP